MCHTEPPTDKTIREWYMKFQQSGCLCAAKRTGRPGPWAQTACSFRSDNGLLIIQVSSTCFGQLFCPSSGALECVLQLVV